MNNFWERKKILITGAAGFVGANAVHYFSDLGADVTAVVSPYTSQEVLAIQLGNKKNNITIKNVDLLDFKVTNTLLKDFETVLHFAALDGGSQYKVSHSAEMFSKNMQINLHMLDASAHNRIKIFLYMSSSDIYSASHVPLTEKSSINIIDAKNVNGYKLSKWTSELALAEYHKQYTTDFVIVRAGNLYGPRDQFNNKERMRVIPLMIKNILHGEDIFLRGEGKDLRSFLFIDDFLSICQQLIEKSFYNKPINVASNKPISIKEIAEKLLSLSNSNNSIMFKQTDITPTTRTFNLSLLHKFVQLKETDLLDGLKKTYEFYLKNY
jgi:nucleoside-diphosphate-sugar epimerase